MSESFLNNKVELHCGDLLVVLPTLAENSIDACVTDPPYHLVSVYKRFANDVRNGATVGKHAYGRHAAGFMGKQWDGGDVAFQAETWAEVYRVLKPGSHLLAFGGTRTFHRLACAIEDAGFEIRDCIMWVYGSGFPKSHDVSKGIDKAAGAEREVIRHHIQSKQERKSGFAGEDVPFGAWQYDITAPASTAARQWEGWGTALKPAVEPIILARKPLSEPTVAANVLRWGTGAINVDGCRVGEREEIQITGAKRTSNCYGVIDAPGGKELPPGRWPANLILSDDEEVMAGFPESGPASSGGVAGWQKNGYVGGKYEPIERTGYDDSGGSAARFFYTAKADSDDRLGSKHPTVKPLDLMQYLVRLVCPRGGTVLDCFAGTGTTGEAAFREGFRAILIEREAEYQADIRRRMKLAMSGPDERARESIKERMKDKPIDHGPLFGGLETEGITNAKMDG